MKSLCPSALLLSLAILSGCASIPFTYPDYKKAPTLSVSSETVSTLTETPAEDALIPDSQVFVTGKGGTGRFLGILGVAIDRSRNEASVSVNSAALKLKFNGQLEAALRKASADVVESGADVLLLPAARLVMRDESSADLSFRVTVRFTDPATGANGRKNYWYEEGVRSLGGAGGWLDGDPSPLKVVSDEAMNRMARVIIDDLAGNYRNQLEPSNQQKVRWEHGTTTLTQEGILLNEESTHFVLAPVVRGRTLLGELLIVPKSLGQIQR